MIDALLFELGEGGRPKSGRPHGCGAEACSWYRLLKETAERETRSKFFGDRPQARERLRGKLCAMPRGAVPRAPGQ